MVEQCTRCQQPRVEHEGSLEACPAQGFDELTAEIAKRSPKVGSIYEPVTELVNMTFSREQWKLITEAISTHVAFHTPLADITTANPLCHIAAEITTMLRYGAPF